MPRYKATALIDCDTYEEAQEIAASLARPGVMMSAIHNGANGHKNLTQIVLETLGTECRYCGGEATTKDHVLPRCQGGTNKISKNLVPACVPCNHSKAGNSPSEWLNRLRRQGKPIPPLLESFVHDRMARS